MKRIRAVRKGHYTDQSVVRDFAPAWQSGCENCGAKPSVPISGLCGPCHFGMADTSGGGWWNESEQTLEDFVFGE